MPIHSTASGLTTNVTNYKSDFTGYEWADGDCELIHLHGPDTWEFEHWDGRDYIDVAVPKEITTLDERIAWCVAYYQMVMP